MSNKHSQSFDKLNELVERNGEEGLHLLFIFKILKDNVIKKISEEFEDINLHENEEEINETCMALAKDIMDRSDDYPNEDDIRRVLSLLKNII